MRIRFYLSAALLLLAHTRLRAQTKVLPSFHQVQSPDTTTHKPIQIRLVCTSSIRPGDEPLWVVDGLPISAEQVKTINPDDIEKIAVLKSTQATALYGSQATNGAILITMKQRVPPHTRKQKRPVN
ncbi:TonB-dependent receptor plug domain-containing protein [Hymenobacter sp. UYP22]|uniref:TonB-dependent receptor plug domain-containing protein n=1 Tax=Hymenobacter sp. UYP22 TaxID=3156348 RepID=UPI0033976917